MMRMLVISLSLLSSFFSLVCKALCHCRFYKSVLRQRTSKLRKNLYNSWEQLVSEPPSGVCVCVFVCVCACISLCVCPCVCVCVCVHAYLSKYAPVYVCVCVCVHAYLSVCAHVYVCVCVCVCMHTLLFNNAHCLKKIKKKYAPLTLEFNLF